jgi:hypothetical protein
MRSILKNKRAAEQSIWLTIAIIVGLVVLAMLIYNIIKGNINFSDAINNLIGGNSANVDKLIDGCRSASIITNSKSSYCSQTRDLKFDDKTLYKGVTCYTLEGMQKFVNAQKDPISGVDCSGYAYVRCTVELKGQWKAVCDQSEEDVATQVKDESDKASDYNPWKTNNKCCAAAKKCTGTSTLKCTSVAATNDAACTKVGCTYVPGANTCKEDAGIDCTKIASGDCKNYSGCSLA